MLEKLGKGVVAYLCMSAVEISADEAKRLGVVIDVFEDEELLPRAIAMIREEEGLSLILPLPLILPLLLHQRTKVSA